ncbi:Agamous-like MADS-box protein AGL61 [Linum perenne]
MVKRETATMRSTTFTKRRHGLFNKLSQLCLLCDAKVAAFVSSPSNRLKFYSLGYPSVSSVLGEEAVKEEGEEAEVIRRTKKLGYSMFHDVAEKDPGRKLGGFDLGKEIDELVSNGGDLKMLVDLLRKAKSRAEAELCRRKQRRMEIELLDSEVDVTATDTGGNGELIEFCIGNQDESAWMTSFCSPAATIPWSSLSDFADLVGI